METVGGIARWLCEDGGLYIFQKPSVAVAIIALNLMSCG
jgi:hypothetical protein